MEAIALCPLPNFPHIRFQIIKSRFEQRNNCDDSNEHAGHIEGDEVNWLDLNQVQQYDCSD